MLFTKKDKAGDRTEEGILEEAEDTEVEEDVLEEESDDTEDDMSQESEISEGFILEKSDDGDNGAVFERDENPIRDTSDDINVYEIDDSNCLWNYVNKISIQGRLYFSEKLKVDETNFTKNMPEDRPKIRVASFNLLIQKSTKNGIKKHWIFIKTYNNKLIEWLQKQSCGTWIRVEGRLESARRNTYVNATSITAFSEAHMQAIFSEERSESAVDWKEAEKVLAETGGGINNDEARSKMRQIKNQVRTMETQANTMAMEDEDLDEPQAMVMAGEELKPEEIEEIRKNTSRFIIYNEDDDEGFDDLKPTAHDDDDDDDEDEDDDDFEDDDEDEAEEDQRKGIVRPEDAGYMGMPGHHIPEFPGTPDKTGEAERLIMQERMDSVRRRERELAERERMISEKEERVIRQREAARTEHAAGEGSRDIFADETEEKYPPIPVRPRSILRERPVIIQDDQPRILRGLKLVQKAKNDKKPFKSRFD